MEILRLIPSFYRVRWIPSGLYRRDRFISLISSSEREMLVIKLEI